MIFTALIFDSLSAFRTECLASVQFLSAGRTFQFDRFEACTTVHAELRPFFVFCTAGRTDQFVFCFLFILVFRLKYLKDFIKLND